MRGKGIAKALMTELLKEMESDPDINKIILEVNPDQESAKRLYHSFNFSDLATYPRLMGDGVEHQITKMERVVMK